MKSVIAIFLASTLLNGFSASRAQAQFVSNNECLLIIASRQTIDEAKRFVRDYGYVEDARDIFRSSNGWYAVSLGPLIDVSSEFIIADMVSLGLIPKDSYCSDGSSYVARAWSSEALVNDTLPSVIPDLTAPFDARLLTRNEKRFLQAGLAMTGFYKGILDGAWGNMTQTAFEVFSRREMDMFDTNASAASLGLITLARLNDDQWEVQWFPGINVSFLMPETNMSIKKTDAGDLNIYSEDGSIDGYIISRSTSTAAFSAHDSVVRNNVSGNEIYTLRETNLLVSSGRSDKSHLYVRSHYDQTLGIWNTLIISHLVFDQSGTAELIISSFQQGFGSRPDYDDNGHVVGLMDAMIYIFEQADKPEVAVDPFPQSDPPAKIETFERHDTPTGSGTGFYFNGAGDIMTNFHVVDGCSSLEVDGVQASVKAVSSQFDLAILTADQLPDDADFLTFAGEAARLNSDVTIAGFPLAGILNGLNITRGSISSMEGMGGDTTTMQITAPVQPGNSGGPIVDRNGQIVGIVVSKLNANYVSEMTGDIPQNVNFGIRGQIGTLFAEINGFPISKTSLNEPLAPEDLADKLKDATVFIECN